MVSVVIWIILALVVIIVAYLLFQKMFKILLIIGIVLALLLISLGIYFYYFHVFYTARVCISKTIEDSTNFMVNCSSDANCLEYVKENSTEFMDNYNKISSIFGEEIANNVLGTAIFCSETCRLGKVYGEGTSGVDKVEQCKDGEEEFTFKITGKKGLSILGNVKDEIKN